MDISRTEKNNIDNFKKYFNVSLYYKNKCEKSNSIINELIKSKIIYMITNFYCLDEKINEDVPFFLYQDIETNEIEKIIKQNNIMDLIKFMKTKLYEDLNDENIEFEERRVFNEDKLGQDQLDERLNNLQQERNII
jgi:hypothetical protein